MKLSVGEIRDRAERFQAAIEGEVYLTRSGLKARPNFATLFSSEPVLSRLDVIPTIERALAQAEGGEETRLRYLLEWAGRHHMRQAAAGYDDEYGAWEASMMLETNGREMPLRQVATRIGVEEKRPDRLHLEALRVEALEELIPMQIDRLIRVREALHELGYGRFLEASERLAGFSLSNLATEGEGFLAATADVYREQLGYQVARRLSIGVDEVDATDLTWLGRVRWLDDYFDRSRVVERVHEDLDALELLPEQEAALQRDFEPRPLKQPGSFCIPLLIPGRVIVGLAPTGGWPDVSGYLLELGRALHFLHTDPQLPYELRALGDMSVNHAYGLVFHRLVLNPAWVERATGLSGSQQADYLRLAAVLDLARVRREAALLCYHVELLSSPQMSEMGERYAELQAEASGAAHDPRGFLEQVDPGFSIARRFRGEMLAIVLEAALRGKYDEDWFRNPGACEFLGSLFASGLSDDATDLAQQWSGDRLTTATLARAAEDRLG